MKSKVETTALQAALTLFPIAIGTIYLPVAGILVPIAGSAGWISVLLAFGVAMLWVVLAAKLSELSPTGDWATAVFSWLGPWVGRLLLAYLVLISVPFGGLLLLQDSLVFHTVALPITPPLALSLATLILVVMTDLYGVETFSRTCQVVLVLSTPLILGALAGMIPASNWGNLLPLLGEGPGRIAHAAYLAMPWGAETVIFTLFLGVRVEKKRHYALFSATAVGVAGVVLAGVVIFNLAVLGRSVVESYIYPSLPLILSASLSSFLKGLELFVYPLWLYTSYIKTTAFFVLASESLRGIIPGLGQPWRAIILGVMYLSVSMVPKNVTEMVAFLSRIDNTFIMPFYAIIPALLLLVWRKRRKKTNA